MTVAVCFKCGKPKRGAFVPCEACGAQPRTEDDLVHSYAMTDWFFDLPTLERMAEAIASGDPPTLVPETREWIVNRLRESGILGMLAPENDPTITPSQTDE